VTIRGHASGRIEAGPLAPPALLETGANHAPVHAQGCAGDG
jgi:hypothetical protein